MRLYCYTLYSVLYSIHTRVLCYCTRVQYVVYNTAAQRKAHFALAYASKAC